MLIRVVRVNSPSTQMAMAMSQHPLYMDGSVPNIILPLDECDADIFKDFSFGETTVKSWATRRAETLFLGGEGLGVVVVAGIAQSDGEALLACDTWLRRQLPAYGEIEYVDKTNVR